MLFGMLRKGGMYLSAKYAEKQNRELNEFLKRAEKNFKKRNEIKEVKFKVGFNEWRIDNFELVKQLLLSADPMVQLPEGCLMDEYPKFLG
ncbi:hypothetical protein CC99x_002535 [Candidatus Berkiella cookevillensis]|uniref:Uncharacterized protein n=2 Tax=Candidatus Berkiella cookevillensis TaxID=437022 RepID=A0AAE3L2S3_9GAMM|nr:hypothetical protein [Candidatus Berkiella cookevillensis]MCS5707776.1 hypothetical protein [Candidatus Berkiella cookevillensis]